MRLVFDHHASISGISSGSDEKIFKAGVVLKKSNDNCKSHEPTVAPRRKVDGIISSVAETNRPLAAADCSVQPHTRR